MPRVRVCVSAHVRAKVLIYDHLTSLWTARGRLAGVLLRGGIQRKHRRVEHGARDYVVLRMRRSAVACNVLRSGARLVLHVCGDTADVYIFAHTDGCI
jgi:hypothetical protein